MKQNKVVITGLGTVNPLGNDVQSTWENVRQGKSGIARITRFEPVDLRVQIAGEVKNFNPEPLIAKKDLKHMGRYIQFAVHAANEALADANLVIDEGNAEDIGVLVGTGIGGLPEIEQNVIRMKERGANRVSPFFIPYSIANMASGLISIHFKTRGYSACTVSACSTGNHAIGDAAKMIERGGAKVMIAGGTEAALCEIGVSGFAALKALSTRNESPQTASRPYDTNRDGFVMSEGCGILILEEESYARQRGAKIYGYLAGYGYSSDAYHITAPNEAGPMLSMKMALQDAGIEGKDIDYINAHGTSTPLGDLNELNAVYAVFGEQCAKNLSVSSTKSMTGHLLGGAGGLESVIAVKAIEDSFVPPTINVFDLDAACKLDVTPNQGKEKTLQYVMSNSFGFGGTNATLIFQKP